VVKICTIRRKKGRGLICFPGIMQKIVGTFKDVQTTGVFSR
jgi:hypothetical protein